MTTRLKFGAFIAPFHSLAEHPGLAIERDLELVEHLERLRYDEAWFGEHHSAGMEIVGSPDIMVAAAAERTKRIKLGTGVVSLPYHNPLMVAQRIALLDLLTEGRVIFGMGPGALPQDAYMLGLESSQLRDMADQAIEAVSRLLRGETVTMKTEWFTLREARLQIRPHSIPHVEMAVANMVSPTGARAAGRFGLSLLSIGATSAAGFNGLAGNWAVAEEAARAAGQTMDRGAWRLCGPFHVAETREKAREQVRFGLQEWLDYFQKVGTLPVATEEGGDPIDAMVDSGLAVIGTPDDLIAKIETLREQSGGFGCFLQMSHNWADVEQTKRSYELAARFVFPKFQDLNGARDASFDWAQGLRNVTVQKTDEARKALLEKLISEQGTANVDPLMMEYLGVEDAERRPA
ncbi:LLM class flavin-dependent oxidoreductase [soil metagenome]